MSSDYEAFMDDILEAIRSRWIDGGSVARICMNNTTLNELSIEIGKHMDPLNAVSKADRVFGIPIYVMQELPDGEFVVSSRPGPRIRLHRPTDLVTSI